MRQPDGRPRGFGYVTLDSPIAAARCLQEPQVIDDRTVDMKRAVPEGTEDADPAAVESAGFPPLAKARRQPRSPGAAAFPPPGQMWQSGLLGTHALAAAKPGMMVGSVGDASFRTFAPSPLMLPEEPCRDPHMAWGGVPWPSAGTTPGHSPSAEGLAFYPNDCLEVLHRHPAGQAGLPYPQLYAMPNTFESGALHGNGGGELSAAAPEFVPKAAMTAAACTADTNIDQEIPDASSVALLSSEAATEGTETSLAQPTRKVLGELTNTIAMGYSCTKESKKSDEVETTGLGGLFGGAENSFEPKRSRAAEDDDDEQILMDDEALGEEESSDSGAASSSGGDSPGGVGADEVPPPPDQPLPSIGSMDHFAGNCRRCNFFPKGRCQNGQDCTFCHYTHERRKPSRQEKRERLAAWQQQQLVPAGGFSPAMADEAESVPLSTPSAMSDLGDERDATQLTYPILPGLPPLCAMRLPSPLALPGAPTRPPPGLAPPERQPGFTPLLATAPVQPMLSPQGSPQSCRPILATVPGGPAAEATTQTLFGNAAQPRTPLSAAATPTEKEAKPLHNLLVCSSTQTEASLDETTPEVEPEEISKKLSPEEAATRWPREELLQLRESLLQEKGEDEAEGSPTLGQGSSQSQTAGTALPRAAVAPGIARGACGGA